MNTRPTTIRLNTDTLNQIDQRCILLKCNRNDYVKNAIKMALTGNYGFITDDANLEINSRSEYLNTKQNDRAFDNKLKPIVRIITDEPKNISKHRDIADENKSKAKITRISYD